MTDTTNTSAAHAAALEALVAELRRERDELRTKVHIITSERDELADCVQSLRARHAELAARLEAIERAEPVAWIEHELQGTGLRHLHFERRPNTLRDDVVAPVWTALIARPACDWPGKCAHKRPAQAAAPGPGERLSEIERWKRIAENAQAVTTGGDDKGDYFEVPSHLIAALALALDEGPGAQGQAGAPAAAPDLDADIIEAQRAVVQQLASRPECDWPGKCKHQHQRPSQAVAPERAAPTDGCGDACRSRASCRLADESPRPADPRTPPPGCRLLGDYEPAQAGDMAYIGAIGGRWRRVRPRMGIIGATMDELSDSARVLALARPCRCGPDGCADRVSCPRSER